MRSAVALLLLALHACAGAPALAHDHGFGSWIGKERMRDPVGISTGQVGTPSQKWYDANHDHIARSSVFPASLLPRDGRVYVARPKKPENTSWCASRDGRDRGVCFDNGRLEAVSGASFSVVLHDRCLAKADRSCGREPSEQSVHQSSPRLSVDEQSKQPRHQTAQVRSPEGGHILSLAQKPEEIQGADISQSQAHGAGLLPHPGGGTGGIFGGGSEHLWRVRPHFPVILAHTDGPGAWINHENLRDPVSGEHCCNLQDCREENNNVTPLPDGNYRINDTGEVIPHKRVIWRSPGSWWRCRRLDGSNSTRCLIGPPPGS